MVAAGEAIAKKLNGSFFGAKIVGGMLKAHPDRRFWCKVLRSNIGGLSLLGDGIGYIADLAENLLPSHAEMCEVTVSKNPFSAHTELARLEDICQAAPSVSSGSVSGDFFAGDIWFAKVLLCRSVLPFQCLYYTAHCAFRQGNSSKELMRDGGSRFAHILSSKRNLRVQVGEDLRGIYASEWQLDAFFGRGQVS